MSISINFAEPEPITVKSPATITGQLKKLKQRGLVINDEAKARRILETINYYRLVHYFAVFLSENGKYKQGTQFDDVIRLYDFDRKLRTEIFVALEEVEIAVRAAVSNYHACKYGATGYLNADSFDRRHNHKMFMHKIGRVIDKNSKLTFVRHHNQKYGGTFPLWVIMEMFSFGMLVYFYQDMFLADKKDIARYYFNLDHRNVENWLENLADLRNHCAHYNRVYGNPLPGELRKIEIDGHLDYETGASLFDYLLVIKLLHKRSEIWGEEFVENMQKLFNDYADLVQPAVLGFPKDWRDYIYEQKQLHQNKG
jgi:abortive infection bacteriophage resistance protein